MKKLVSVFLCCIMIFSVTTLFTDVASAKTDYSSTYWLKVNEQRNVVTAYKKVSGKWKPVRAMLCSCGVNGTTPRGTFYTKGRWQWGKLMDDVYGQYCTHITGDILFHSVWYYKPYHNAQTTYQYNLLGYNASHGCVRLSTIDAKWIYENCKRGTKVTIYRSSKSGALGKPKGIKVATWRTQYWDPTDPLSSNPYHLIRKPIIKISSKKPTSVQYGKSAYLTSYVSAKDPNTFMNLTSLVKVYSVRKYSKGKYVKAKFSTKSLGTYKITYRVKDPYSKTSYKTFKITVKDNAYAPTIYGVTSRKVLPGTINAVKGVYAKQKSQYRSTAMKIYIKAPGSSKYLKYTYAQAKNYKFSKEGKYYITYTVRNRYSPYKIAKKKYAVITAVDNSNTPMISAPTDRNVTVGQTNAILDVTAKQTSCDRTSAIKTYIMAPGQTDFSTPYSYDDAVKYVFDTAGIYTIKYVVTNKYSPYKEATKTITVNCN